MKRVIRSNVFETASSSVHTLTIVTEEAWDKLSSVHGYLKSKNWNDNTPYDIDDVELYNDIYDKALKAFLEWKNLKESDVIDNVDIEVEIEDYVNDYIQDNYVNFDDDYLDHDLNTLITKSGEVYKLFCTYGHDY